MDPPTYPFEETSFMDGPLAHSLVKYILILILHQLANGYLTPSLSLLSGVNNIFIMA